MPRPVPISQSGCCDSFLIIFRIEVCPVLRLLFSERRSAQVLSDYDSVPDKTLKRYKAARNHRIVPLKTFSQNKCCTPRLLFPYRKALLGFCFRIERHASTSVPVKARLLPGTMPSCGIFPYSRSILFLMHVRNLYSSAETQGLAILLPRLSGIGRKPSSLSGGEARSCLGGEALQKQIPDFH